MKKLDNSKSVSYDKKDVLICERIITCESKELESYRMLLIDYIKAALKDNHLIVFIIVNFNAGKKGKKNTSNAVILKIQKWLKSVEINSSNQFLFIKKDKDFDFNLAFGLDNQYSFLQNNTICLFEDPKIGEQVFFNKFFTVFLNASNIDCDGNYKITKKVSHCVIEDDSVSSWNYDRISYEFFSFLDSKKD